MNHSVYGSPHVVISGHTIFEVSARSRTPTSWTANAMKTRMKKVVLLLLASSCLPLASGVALLTTASLNPGSCLTGMVSARATFECNHQLPR